MWRLWRKQKQLPNKRGLHEDLLSKGTVPVVRQGPGHRRRGRAGERGGAQGPHTIHSAQGLPPCCCQEERLQCPVKATLSEFSRERMAEGQPLMPLCDHLNLNTCSSVSVGNTDSATLQGRSAVLLYIPHMLGKFSSSLFVI